MNCEQVKQSILLEHSGELGARACRSLARHLADCSECAEYKERIMETVAVVAEGLPGGLPGDAVVARIVEAAGDRSRKPGVAAERERRVLVLVPGRAQMLAYAAALLVLAGAAYVYLGMPAPEARSGRVSRMGVLVAVMSEAPEERSGAVTASGDEKEKLRALAMQLLKMEGLHYEEAAGEEMLTSPEEPYPTDLQSRSRNAFLQEECV